MKGSLSFFVFLATVAAADRTFTVKNNCAYTVWPGLFTDPASGSAAPSQPTGWELGAGGTTTFSVSDNWTGGNIWARTGCNASGQCATGECKGGLQCTDGPSDSSPVTVASFSLGGSQETDITNVFITNGFNVPIGITNSAGCPTVSCATDLTANCPTQLQFKDSTGTVVGCSSDCQISSDPTNSPACCTGSYSTPSTCPARGVPHYSFFKNGCPEAVVYAFDETSSPLPCPGSNEAGYTVTFCP
ncbi:Osmotin, thaumatin-like protein [Peniophora sp. CONT]|nr:Osmotin, thaumatin-like protein [Peniophora sp. CONT]